jgi:predicted transcriptional regulator
MMPLGEVCRLLACECYAGEEQLETVRIRYGCASDLMSDVLAFSRSGAILLTGLVTNQTIQTADIAEIAAVVVVRGKVPAPDVTALAREKGIPLLATPYSMYEACGLLYRRGLHPTMEPVAGRTEHPA